MLLRRASTSSACDMERSDPLAAQERRSGSHLFSAPKVLKMRIDTPFVQTHVPNDLANQFTTKNSILCKFNFYELPQQLRVVKVTPALSVARPVYSTMTISSLCARPRTYMFYRRIEEMGCQWAMRTKLPPMKSIFSDTAFCQLAHTCDDSNEGHWWDSRSALAFPRSKVT